MKGISLFFSYITAIIVSIIVISSITLIFFNIQKNITENQIKKDFVQLSNIISSKITLIYNSAEFSKYSKFSNNSIKLSEIKLNLPEKIGNRNYKISLSKNNLQTMIIIETVEDPIISIEYYIPNIDINIQGDTFNPHNTKLKYIRYNENNNTIILEESKILNEMGVIF